MIGRDKITISYTKDSVPVVRTIWGRVTPNPWTRSWSRSATRWSSSVSTDSTSPRSLALTGASNIRVSFRYRANTPLVTGIIPVYDARGRIHHYEAVVRSS